MSKTIKPNVNGSMKPVFFNMKNKKIPVANQSSYQAALYKNPKNLRERALCYKPARGTFKYPSAPVENLHS